VNAASTQSAPATTYTYDPAGTPTMSGTANDWPFLYQGGEKEGYRAGAGATPLFHTLSATKPISLPDAS
jgi:hypothetical protein